MNLDRLMKELGVKGEFADTEITSVTEKIENVTKGSIFAAVKESYTTEMII